MGRKRIAAGQDDMSRTSFLGNDRACASFAADFPRPYRISPIEKVISVVLSLLLAVTLFDPRGMAYAVEVASDTAAQAEQTSQTDSDREPENQGSSDNASDSDMVGNENSANSESTAQDDAPADADVPENIASSSNEDSDATEAGDDIDGAEEDALSPDDFLPKNLTDPSQVLPDLPNVTNQETSRLSALLSFDIIASGKINSDDDGYRLSGSSADFDLSATGPASIMGGAKLARANGAAAGLVVTFDAPFFYHASDGTLVSTTSREEWLAAKGDENGYAAAIAFDKSSLTGWSAWTAHADGYLSHSVADAAQGLSGSIVLRYEGAMPFGYGSALPKPKIFFTDSAPAEAFANIGFGWSFAHGKDATGNDLSGAVAIHDDVHLSISNKTTDAKDSSITVETLAQTSNNDSVSASYLVTAFRVPSATASPITFCATDFSGVSDISSARAFSIDAANTSDARDIAAKIISGASAADCAIELSMTSFDENSASFAIDAARTGSNCYALVTLEYASDALADAAAEQNGASATFLSLSDAFSFKATTTSPKGIWQARTFYDANINVARGTQGDEGSDKEGFEDDGADSSSDDLDGADDLDVSAEGTGSGAGEDVAKEAANDTETISAMFFAPELLTLSLVGLPLYASADVLTPDMFSPYIQVSTTGTAIGNNQYVISNEAMASTRVTLGATLAFDNGYLGGSLDNAVAMTIKIPYLYTDSDGGVQSTYDRDKWNSLKDPANEMFISMRPDATTLDHWRIYAGDYCQAGSPNPSAAMPSIPASAFAEGGTYAAGMVGTFTLVYMGTGGTYKLSNGFQLPTFTPTFHGEIPENSGGVLELSSKITHFHDNNTGTDIDGAVAISHREYEGDDDPIESENTARLGISMLGVKMSKGERVVECEILVHKDEYERDKQELKKVFNKVKGDYVWVE